MRNLKLVFTLALMIALTACGSSKSGGDGFGEADLASGTASSTDAIAVCSKDMGGLSDLEVHAQQYVDIYGQTHADLIRLQFKIAPAAWQSSNLDLSVYRWTASPTGSVSLDSSELNFQFEKKVSGGFQLIKDASNNSLTYRKFNWNDIVQMGTYASISTTSPQSFWNTASIVVDVRDTTNSYQALQIVLWDSSGAAARKVDLLIPTFQADPAKYNADSRHPQVLRNIHPLKALLGQSWSQTNYDQFARAFCF